MTTYNIPQTDSGLGVPSQSSDVLAANLGPLLLSPHPAAETFDEIVAASQTLVAFTVVGKDANGRLVKSTWHASTPILPIGVIAEAITTDGTTNYKGALVWKTGHFNMARLVWDVSYDTDAKKLAAIRALEPHIRVGAPASYTP